MFKIRGTSVELQEISIVALINDPYLLSKCITEIREEFYDNLSYRLIYKVLKGYYTQYMVLPSIENIKLEISTAIDLNNYGKLEDIYADVDKIYSQVVTSPDFLAEKTIEFIRRNKIEKSLEKVYNYMNNTDNVDLDAVASDLRDSIYLNFTRAPVLNLADISSIHDVRVEALGSGTPVIVKFFIDDLNKAFQYKGLIPGTLNMICFVGSTRILTLDGHSHTIEELYEMNKKGIKNYIYTIDTDKMSYGKWCSIAADIYSDVVISGYVNDTVVVTLENGYRIECTPNQKFMLRDGTYLEARFLESDMSLMPVNRGYKRIAPRIETSKENGYECVTDGNGKTNYTHYIVARDYLTKKDGETEIHHIDFNRLNNNLWNLTYISISDHRRITYHHCKENGIIIGKPFTKGHHGGSIIQKGEHRSVKTELTPERVSCNNRNPIIKKNQQIGKIMKCINRLCIDFGEDYIRDIDKYRSIKSLKDRVVPSFENIIKYMDLSDVSDLRNNWDYIVDRSLIYNHSVKSVEFKHYDEAIPVYDLVDTGRFHNFAVQADQNDMAGVFVHNCSPPGRGKTTMLINQGVSTAKQGYKILHVFLGDMSRYDGLLRYLSCFTGVPTTRLVDLNDEELGRFIQKYNMSGYLANIDISSYGAGQLSASQLIEEITTIQKDSRIHYDVIIIDYDENINDEEDNMYKSGGNVYNKLALFAVVNKSVVFIASQPKTGFWDKDIITLEAASESSKKQKIIDLMITLGKTAKNSKVGTMYLAKNRRGEDSKIFRIKTDGATARMTHISEAEYNQIKQEEKSSV